MGSDDSAKPSCQFGIDFRWRDLMFSGRYDQEGSNWKLSAVAQNLPSLAEILQKLLKTPELPYLPLIPDVKIDKLGAVFSKEAMEFGTTMALKWQPNLGSDAKKVTFEFDHIEFYCKLPKKGNPDCYIRVHGSFCIPDAVSVESFEFKFKYKEGNWLMEADMLAMIFDYKAPHLHASYAHGPGKDRLSLSVIFDKPGTSEGLKLIDIKNVFYFAVDDFSITFTKKNLPQEPQHENQAWTLEISSTAHLAIEHFRKFSGSLSISQSSIFFTSPDVFDLTVVKTAELDFGVTTSLKDVTITWGHGNNHFQADLTLSLKKKGMPEFLKGALPDSIDKAGFRIGQSDGETAVEFYAKGIEYPDAKPFQIPAISGIDLSRFSMIKLELNAFGLKVGEKFATWVTLTVGLPENMNDIFGTRKGGDGHDEPILRLFNTLPNLIRIQFQVSFSLKSDEGSGFPFGASLQLLDPPFLPDWILHTQDDSQETRDDQDDSKEWHILLGKGGESGKASKYGEIKVDSPKLEFKDGSFASGAKITVEEELRIPLAPLQWLVALLTGKKIEEIQKILPESAPIIFPSLLDDQGHLTGVKLVEMLKENLGSSELLDPVEAVLKALDNVADRLPRDLKPYLMPQYKNGLLGEELEYDFSINVEEASGSISIKMNPPVRSLSFGATRLVGCTFKSFSFGPVLGGSLFKLKLDCTFDQFDIAGLLFDLCIPRDLPLPFSRDFNSRLVLDNFIFLIEYETAIPIPIPVYFERLKVDYLDVLGFAYTAHAYYDKPELSLAGLIDLFKEFVDFIKDNQHRLDLSEKAAKLFPAFYLSNWYIQLPEWIGKDKYLGFKVEDIDGEPEEEQEKKEKEEAFFAIDTAAIMQKTLNNIKFLSFEDLIRKIPEKYRAGDVDLATRPFLGLTLEAGAKWVVTTPDDFLLHWDQYDQIVKDVNSANNLVKIFPGDIKASTRGAICFTKAGVRLAVKDVSVANLNLTLGLISIDGHKVDSAFLLEGQIGLLSADIRGLYYSDPKQKKMMAKIASKVVYAGLWELFHGEMSIAIDNNEFAIKGDVAVLPYCNLVKLDYNATKTISEEKGLEIDAGADLSAIGLLLVGGKFHADQHGLRLTGHFLAAEIVLTLTIDKDRFTYSLQEGIPAVIDYALKISFSKSEGVVHTDISYTFLSSLKYAISCTLSEKNKPFSGSFTLSQFGFKVLGGTTSISGDGYKISGDFHLFPPGSPINYTVGMKGSLTAKGLLLTGGVSHNLLGLTLSNGITIDTQKGISIRTTVKVFGVEVSHTKSGLEKMDGGIGFWVTYYLWPLHWYLMVGPKGIYGPSPIRPRNWPEKSVRTLAAPVPAAKPKPKAPTEAMPILELLKQVYLEQSQSLAAGQDHERFGPVMKLYGLEITSTEDKNKANASRLPLYVTIEAWRPDVSKCKSQRNIFTEMEKGTLNLLMQDKAFKDNPEEQKKALDWLNKFNKITFTGSNGCGMAHAVWQAEKTEQAVVECHLDRFDNFSLQVVSRQFKERFLATGN